MASSGQSLQNKHGEHEACSRRVPGMVQQAQAGLQSSAAWRGGQRWDMRSQRPWGRVLSIVARTWGFILSRWEPGGL